MAEDPDAMWKPGFIPPAAEPDAAGVSEGVGSGGQGLPDRIQAAVGRRAGRVPDHDCSAGAGIADRPAVDAVHTATPGIATSAWVVEQPADSPTPTPPPRRTLRHVAVVVVALVSAGVLVSSVLGDDSTPRRPEPSELAGADARRLPAEVDELWSTVLAGSGTALASSVIVEGRDVVVAVVDDGSRNRTMMVGVDASTGAMRWRRSFSFAPPEVSLIGVIDGVILVEQNELSRRRLFGLATVDGATLWERETAGDGANTVLLGTDVVANLSFAVNDLITFVDPLTGEPVGDVVGELLSTDLAGTWYLSDRSGGVVSIDLADGWAEPAGVTDGAPPSGVAAVVDGRLLVTDQRGRLSELSGPDVDRSTLVGADDLPRITSLFPAGAASFVGLNDGEVFGLELEGDSVQVTWNRTASMRGFALTERGLVLSLSDAGAGFVDGVDLVVVDAVTGDRLAGSTGTLNELDALPLIVGDGFVTVNDGVDGVERLGYDLEGTELWRLPVSGKVRVGDELIVVMTNTPAGYELTAYGSAS